MILEHFDTGHIRVVKSQQVLQEVVRTVKEKLPDSLSSLTTLLINAPPLVEADPTLPDMKHWTKQLQSGDAAVLAAAIAARPDYFVTGDRHFTGNRSISEESGLRIVTPGQLLELLELSEN